MSGLPVAANEPHPNAPGADAADAAGGLPANLDAEHALLGCALYDNEAFRLVDHLEGRHFYEPFHGRLWAAIGDKVGKGVLAEPIGLAEQFARDPAFAELGGVPFLADLVDQAPAANAAPSLAEVIKALSRRRDLIRLAQEVGEGARTANDTDEVIAHISTRISELDRDRSGDSWVSGGEAIRAAIEHARTRTGRIDYPYGIPSLDRFTGGMNAGEVTILAARPGMGKTVGALSVARASASAGLGTCMFSLEMTRSALGMRLACDLAYDRGAPVFSGVPTCPTFDRAMKGELDDAQWRCLIEAEETVSSWPLMIDDRSGLTMATIEAAARRQHREWRRRGIKPGPVIIDHLGKVKPQVDRRGSKHAEVADVSGDAQVMAKRLGVPVLALVQLNRGVENREDKLPQLSDLRQAGELEEDARQVIFLFRPEYYIREAKPDENFEDRAERLEKLQAVRNQMFWIVEKNSHGPRGQVQSFCEIACSAIREW